MEPRLSMRIRCLALCAVLVMALTGCGRATQGGSKAQTGEIHGSFIAVGGPAGAPNAPQIGVVTLMEMTTKETFRVRSGADGRFTIALPPGTYTAVGLTPEFQVNNREAQCDSVGAASVIVGRTVPLTVVCERI